MLSTSLSLAVALCCSADAATSDTFEKASDVRRFSFEEGEDRDFDGQPDDWVRRKGPQFPRYVGSVIDRTRGHHGEHSLRIDLNGGQAAYYSPLVRIDARHAYTFRGFVRTQAVEHHAALVSLSLLNHRRQRIRRVLTKPVSGTHDGWVEVRIGPVEVPEETRFAVIGCHLLRGKEIEIDGAVWFDDLWLGRVPRLTLLRDFAARFVPRGTPIRVRARASGLDPGFEYRVRLELLDDEDRVLDEATFPLSPDAPLEEAGGPAGRETSGAGRAPLVWEAGLQENGFYRVRARLDRDGATIYERSSPLVVMDFVEPAEGEGFGWTVAGPPRGIPPEELVEIATQAGVNWLKYPVWRSASSSDAEQIGAVSDLFQRLVKRNVAPVGVLLEPPKGLRGEFAREWSGVVEIFSMPVSFWSESLDAVMAHYSTHVRYWQLGGDDDFSFVGADRLGETVENVWSHFARIGRETRVGLNWKRNAPPPAELHPRRTFLSLDARDAEGADLASGPNDVPNAIPRWVVLAPRADEPSMPKRATDLAKRMVSARIGGAEVVFAHDVFGGEDGLLDETGAPMPMFLPWRVVALALRGTEYAGSIEMPNGSPNHVFLRDDEAVIVAWNDRPTNERIYLGENVEVVDLWGRSRAARVEREPLRQVIELDETPVVLRGCSPAVAAWRLGVRFERGRVRSSTEAQAEKILGRNTFGERISGHVTLDVPGDWETEPPKWPLQVEPGEAFALPVEVTLPANARLGRERAVIAFTLTADRPRRFAVYRPVDVGLDDLMIRVEDRLTEDGRLEVEQIIENETGQVLDFRATLFVPGHPRQHQVITGLGEGVDRRFYHLADGESFRGKELWIRARQMRGRRVLNYRWTVGKNWGAKR